MADWTLHHRVRTLLAARRHGIQPCSGLIVGMGETSQRWFEWARGEILPNTSSVSKKPQKF